MTAEPRKNPKSTEPAENADASVGNGSNVLDDSTFFSSKGESPSSGLLNRDHGLELDRLEEQEPGFDSTEIGIPGALEADSPLTDGLDGSTCLSDRPVSEQDSGFVLQNLDGANEAKSNSAELEIQDTAEASGFEELLEGDSPTVIRNRKQRSGEDSGVESDHALDELSINEKLHANLAPRELGAALVGKRLQNYQLEEFVGGGGMGAVLRATDETLGRTVAVKILARSGRNGELEKRFINEAQSAAKLDHEHIARVYNVGESNGLNFIVFEFVEGVNLRDSVIEHGLFSVEEVIRFTMQVAEALEHATERSVIHRDIKPSNIILTKDNKVKLVDMGLARVQRLDTEDPELTASGMTLGTFDYLSPEQARDPRRADVRSDLYSLGCTIYFLLTGQPPYPEGGAVEKLLQHRDGKRPDPRKLNQAVPAELAQIIRRLMAPNPASRFQTPEELIAVLTVVGRSMGITFSSPVVERALSRYMNRRRGLYRVLPVLIPTLLLIGGLVAANWFAKTRDKATAPIKPLYERGAILLRPPARATAAVNSSGGSTDSNRDENGRRSPSGSGASQGTRSGLRNGEVDGTGNTPGNRGLVGPGDPQDEPATSLDNSAATGLPEVANPTPRSLIDPLGILSLDPTRTFENGVGSGANEAYGLNRNGTNNVTPVGVLREPGDLERTLIDSGFAVVDLEVRKASIGKVDSGFDFADPTLIRRSSLQELLVQLPQFPNLETIELAYEGFQSVSQIEIIDRALSVKAAQGYRPGVLVSAGEASKPAFVRMHGAILDWEGIDFVWDGGNTYLLPSTLFQIQPGLTPEGLGPKLSFRRCTISTREQRKFLVPPDLALVEIQKASRTFVDQDEIQQVIEPPVVELQQVAVRGPAKMIQVPEATAFYLVWNQGLFASSNRLIEAQGTERDEFGFRMRAALSNVTVAAYKGLARVAVNSEEQSLLRFELEADSCIFEMPLAKAFIEHVVSESTSDPELLMVRSSSSFFPDTIPIWELHGIRDLGPLSRTFIREASENQDWFEVDRGELASSIVWNVPFAERQGRQDRCKLSDYQVKPDATNPAFFTEAGFSLLEVPSFPQSLEE